MYNTVLKFLKQQWFETVDFIKGNPKSEEKPVKHCRCCRACGACPRGKL